MHLTNDDIKRFWAKVTKSDNCWLWNAGKDKDGYGQFWLNSEQRSIRAHRISYFLKSGEVPEFALHTCDNPSCVNPNHLYNGNHLQNQRDRVSRKRSARGSKHSRHKLNEDQVKTIKELLRVRKLKYVDIARMFNVSAQTIYAIREGRTWIHVQ